MNTFSDVQFYNYVFQRQMDAMGLKPDKITHHFMVMTFAKAGVFNMADQYIRKMIDRKELPTMEMYNDLVTEACARNLSMVVSTPYRCLLPPSIPPPISHSSVAVLIHHVDSNDRHHAPLLPCLAGMRIPARVRRPQI